MAWWKKIYKFTYEPKIEENMDLKGKSLYELSQNQEWKEKWCVRHPDSRANMPITSRLGTTIISNPVDCSKLAESTYAHRQGQSKPFSLSEGTLSLISKI